MAHRLWVPGLYVIQITVLGRLRQFQEELETNQERANRLKSSKFEIKSKSCGLAGSVQSDDLSESEGSSTSSIDNLTDRYMDIQDQGSPINPEISGIPGILGFSGIRTGI